jgi:Domain of unknown function (DUF1735)
MKNILNIKSVLAGITIGTMLVGCLKPNKKSFTDFSTTEDKVLISASGIANAGKKPANILVAGSTDSVIIVDVEVQLASKNLNQTELTVVLDKDDAARLTYNAQDKLAVGFEAMPDSCYSFPSKTLVIKPGTNFATTKLMIYPAKVDISRSYMLPITIKDAGGKSLTSNANTQYFNIIGNELAGPYNWTFRRYNNTDSVGALNGTSFVDDAGLILPVTPTSISLTSGYFIQPRLVVSYKKSAGAYSDFKVTFNETDLKTLTDNGITITDGPNLWVADPIARKFVVSYTVFNGAANRFLIDDYHQ